ncbi:MAG: hypothetical protein AB1656_13640 [Candidatus Omnitrophota bacterium]
MKKTKGKQGSAVPRPFDEVSPVYRKYKICPSRPLSRQEFFALIDWQDSYERDFRKCLLDKINDFILSELKGICGIEIGAFEDYDDDLLLSISRATDKFAKIVMKYPNRCYTFIPPPNPPPEYYFTAFSSLRCFARYKMPVDDAINERLNLLSAASDLVFTISQAIRKKDINRACANSFKLGRVMLFLGIAKFEDFCRIGQVCTEKGKEGAAARYIDSTKAQTKQDVCERFDQLREERSNKSKEWIYNKIHSEFNIPSRTIRRWITGK